MITRKYFYPQFTDREIEVLKWLPQLHYTTSLTLRVEGEHKYFVFQPCIYFHASLAFKRTYIVIKLTTKMTQVSSSIKFFWSTIYRECFQVRVDFFFLLYFFFFFLSAVSLHFLLSLKNCTTNCQQEVTYLALSRHGQTCTRCSLQQHLVCSVPHMASGACRSRTNTMVVFHDHRSFWITVFCVLSVCATSPGHIPLQRVALSRSKTCCSHRSPLTWEILWFSGLCRSACISALGFTKK